MMNEESVHTPAGRIVPGGGNGDWPPPTWFGSYGLYPYIDDENDGGPLHPDKVVKYLLRGSVWPEVYRFPFSEIMNFACASPCVLPLRHLSSMSDKPIAVVTGASGYLATRMSTFCV